MAVLPVKKIAVAGVLSAITIVLGITRLGFIPWFSGASLTIMHVPVIIGAILEGPVVGLFIGLLFGLFSLIQAVLAPTGPIDVAFANPLISVLPRLLVGPAVWLVYRLVAGKKDTGETLFRSYSAIILSAITGSLVNSVLVLSGLGLFKFFPWELIAAAFVANGPLEAAAAALISAAVISAYRGLSALGGKAKISTEEEDQ